VNKTITVMLDDVLNNFTEMLNNLGIKYNAEKRSISDKKYLDIFYTPSGNLTPVAEKAMGSALARQDGVEFFKWLKDNGWTVLLCTNRDIRLTYDITKKWLEEHHVMYDYLFTATTPAGLCMDMNITFMVYNLPNGKDNHFNVVSFRMADGDEKKQPFLLGDFQNFGEVKKCILKTDF
jgi:hypothetical protein